MVESLLFVGAGAGAGAGAGEKNTRSRPKTDRLHNTACVCFTCNGTFSKYGLMPPGNLH